MLHIKNSVKTTARTRTQRSASQQSVTKIAMATTSCRCCCYSWLMQTVTSSANSNACHCSNSCRRSALAVLFLLVVLYFCDHSEAALRNVNLYIEPPAVRRGQAVTLSCHYDLEGAPLYAAKFYRGQLEFYRYTPGEHPSTKVFHYPGIKVDELASNATQAVIRDVGFNLSGNFSCEITADAPLFSTATSYASMQVVEFPEKRPQLFTEHNRYEPGDVLRANCSTPPSRPRAELRFTINNVVVSSGETQYIRTVDNLIASRLSLKLQLQGIHFAAAANPHTMNGLAAGGGGSGGGGSYVPGAYGRPGQLGSAPGGGLVLRCTAQIGDLYQEYKEIELGTPQRDPVPARVTLSSGSGLKGFFDSYFSSSSAASINARHGVPAAITRWTTTTAAVLLLLPAQQFLTISAAVGCCLAACHSLQLLA